MISEEQRRKISAYAKNRTGKKNPFYGKAHSEEVKKKISEALKRKHREWKEKNPEEYRLRQINAGKKTTGGKITAKKHPSQFREMAKITREKYSKEYWKEISKKGGIKGIIKLKEWKEKNPEKVKELAKKNWLNMVKNNPSILSETAKKTHKKYPDLAKRLGKITQTKHPELAKKLGQWVIDHPKEMSKRGKRTMEKHPGQASRMGKITHQRHPEQARWMGLRTNELHPELAKERGLKSIELQTKKGFFSKPERIMKNILPTDFIHNERLGNIGVPDFHSKKRKIIIEVDGIYWHSKEENKKRDKAKDSYYKKMGYEVYRFKDIDIVKDIDSVKERLRKILERY